MKPKNIVVGFDLSETSELAVEAAIELARFVGVSSIHLVHIVDRAIVDTAYPMGYPPTHGPQVEELKILGAKNRLEALSGGDIDLTHDIRVGIPARDLAAAAEEVEADIIVVASQGRNVVQRAMYGSVTSALLRVAHCPVLVVSAKRRHLGFETVVAGVDLSPVAKQIVELAVALTAKDGRTELVSAYEAPLVVEAEGELLPHIPTDAERDELRQVREAAVRRLVPEGDGRPLVAIEALAKSPPGNAIIDCAELLNADLVVIGTSGNNAWHRAFVGSTAMRVLFNAPCPVLMVPHS